MLENLFVCLPFDNRNYLPEVEPELYLSSQVSSCLRYAIE